MEGCFSFFCLFFLRKVILSFFFFSFGCCFLFCFVAPLPHLTSDDVDKALQNSPRLMHARNTGNAGPAPFPQTRARSCLQIACFQGGTWEIRVRKAEAERGTGRGSFPFVGCSVLKVPQTNGRGRPLVSELSPLPAPFDKGFLLTKRCAELAFGRSLSSHLLNYNLLLFVPNMRCSDL